MRSDRCASWLNYDKEGGSLVGDEGDLWSEVYAKANRGFHARQLTYGLVNY